MNIGSDPELRPMVRGFMEACLRRLDIRRTHLWLLSPVAETIREETESIPDKPIQISMPVGGDLPLEFSEVEALCWSLLQSNLDEPVVETLKLDNLYFYLYPMKGIGALVLERADSPLPPKLLQALLPVANRFGFACKAAFQHEQIVQEVIRRTEAEKRIEHLAHHNDLTGLPNRRSLLNHIDNVITQTKVSGCLGILLHVDLDNFKDINESLGYLIGDSIIKEMAERLRHLKYNDLLVTSPGSDEFSILHSIPATSKDELRAHAIGLARTIQKTIAEPCILDERTITLSASIGIILFNDDCPSGEVLLGQSSHAMYQAKELGRHTVHFFDTNEKEDIAQKLTLDSEMRTALRENQFALFLQPQVDENGIIIGAEALMRWLHPEKGMVPPSAFIPMAEKSGFIVPMSDWVLKCACGYVNQLEELNLFPEPGYIAVNLSAKYFHQADFVDRIIQIQQEMGTNPRRIELEITEGTFINSAKETIDKMNQLRELGFRFSIDDFGTGYSSIAYLKKLPIDRIKIDRSFVSNVDTSPDDAMIVSTVLSMAEHFQLNVIAEGVETEAEWKFLINQGCREFQGFYFSKGIPFKDFITLLTEKKDTHSQTC